MLGKEIEPVEKKGPLWLINCDEGGQRQRKGHSCRSGQSICTVAGDWVVTGVKYRPVKDR